MHIMTVDIFLQFSCIVFTAWHVSRSNYVILSYIIIKTLYAFSFNDALYAYVLFYLIINNRHIYD